MLRRLLPILGRCLRLRCPRCGQGRMFEHAFTLSGQCDSCAFSFEPEQGYYVGAIYLNYAAVVLIAIPGFLFLDYWTDWSFTQQMLVWTAFAIGFPILCFRHSKSLWLSLDYFFTQSSQASQDDEGSRSDT